MIANPMIARVRTVPMFGDRVPTSLIAAIEAAACAARVGDGRFLLRHHREEAAFVGSAEGVTLALVDSPGGPKGVLSESGECVSAALSVHATAPFFATFAGVIGGGTVRVTITEPVLFGGLRR